MACLDLVILVDEIEQVELLTLVLMQTFGLDIKHGIGVYGDILRMQQPVGKGLFVGLLHGGQLVQHRLVLRKGQQLFQFGGILAEAGATPADVTKVTVFIVDMAEFQIVNGVYSETFGADAPARSCVAVAALPKGARVEIEAIAVL